MKLLSSLKSKVKNCLEGYNRKSLTGYGAIIICDNTDYAVELTNKIAPEHLEVFMENPMEYLGCLDNAGSIFLGQYTTESLEIIMQVLIMFCQQAEQQDFSHHLV